ncbi:MAG: DUF5667 domain-containing protein [Candidatus Paceibacterota bacterium]|jgi:hypothetical protein
MKNNRPDNYIHDLITAKLSSREKHEMISHILGRSFIIKSPYVFVSSFVSAYHKKAIAMAVMVLVILASGGTSYAAESSLPGDTLYNVKININEGIQTLVAIGPDAKAKVGVDRTNKRLAEAETLSKQGRLNKENQAIIETNIKNHTNDIKENIATLASENATATVKQVVSELKTSLDVHEAVLATISSSTVSTSTSSNIDSLIESVNKVKDEITVIGDKVASSTDSNATSTKSLISPELNASSTATSTTPTSASSTTSSASSTIEEKKILPDRI